MPSDPRSRLVSCVRTVRAHLLRHWQSRLAAGAALLVVLALAADGSLLLQDLRFWAFDRLQNAAPRSPTARPVVIVDIDEDSLELAGQWPWPRTVVAELVARIAEADPVAIGFDIIFAEPDRASPDMIARTVPNLPASLQAELLALPTNDQRLAEVLSATPSVLGVGILPERTKGKALTSIGATPHRRAGGDPLAFLPESGVPLASIPMLNRAARGRGILSAPPERDGTVRRLPAVFEVAGQLHPGFALEILRVAVGQPAFSVFVDAMGFEGVGAGPVRVPTDPDGRFWLHFSPHLPERFVSAADILNGTADPALFRQKLVLIGFTGLGLIDFPATPIDPRVPGVEIHAQLLESILENGLLDRPAWALGAELGAALVLGLLMIALTPLLRPAPSSLLPSVSLLVLAAGAWVGFAQLRLLLDPALPMVATVVSYGVMLGFTLVAVDRARRALQRDLAEQKAAAQRLEGELSAARNIQMGLVPRVFPAFPHRAELQIFARMEPAKAVGGDLYDFFELADGRILFLVGDVAGKGVPAALFMALTKAFCRGCALRATAPDDPADLGAIMTEANALIAAENEEMLFVTLFAGVVDPGSGRLAYVNAGHEAPFLARADASVERLAGETGPPLCVVDDWEYVTSETTLSPSELLVVISDGVSEAQNPEKALFGVARVERYLGDSQHLQDPEDAVAGLFDAVKAFAAGAEPSDDITLLAMKVAAPVSGLSS